MDYYKEYFKSDDEIHAIVITAIFLVCHKFQIVNAIIRFVFVLMIDLHTLWNCTFMCHVNKPMHSHVLFDSLIIKHIDLFISSFCNTLW